MPAGGMPQLFFPTADELRAMMQKQQEKDVTYIKLVEYVTSLFPEVGSMNDVTQFAIKAMPSVEKFIVEQLSQGEQSTLEFQTAFQLFEFTKQVGASGLPDSVKEQLWSQMQRAMQVQYQRMQFPQQRFAGNE